MGLIEINKWKDLWEYVLQHIPAVSLGLLFGILGTVGLYQLILLPAQQAQIEAKLSTQNTAQVPASGTTKTVNQCLRTPIVVFIDGNGTFAGYHGSNENISTANFLVEKARDDKALGFDAKDAILPKEGKIDSRQIVDLHPDLVVVHRSTFDLVSKNSEERLKELVRKLASAPALFLIYSRTPGTDGVYAAELAQETGTEGRVFSYQFQTGHPFKDTSTVIYFLRYINMMALARVANLDGQICEKP